MLFNDLCSVSLYSFSGLAWGKQRQANFINVLKFHSGVPWSPLCCVLELSELPRNIYFWKKKLYMDVFWNQVSDLSCIIIFLECWLIYEIYIYIYSPPHSRRWETLIVESSLIRGLGAKVCLQGIQSVSCRSLESKHWQNGSGHFTVNPLELHQGHFFCLTVYWQK